MLEDAGSAGALELLMKFWLFSEGRCSLAIMNKKRWTFIVLVSIVIIGAIIIIINSGKEKEYAVSTSFNNINEAYIYAQDKIKALGHDVVLITYSARYPASDLESKPMPMSYDFQFKVVQPDLEIEYNTNGYYATIDLKNKSLKLKEHSVLDVALNTRTPIEIPDVKEVYQIVKKSYGRIDDVIRSGDIILKISREYTYRDVPDFNYWMITFERDDSSVVWSRDIDMDKKEIVQEY